MESNSSAARAWHARAHPGFQRLHEPLMRERWSCASHARRPSPEDERIHFHMLDDLLPGTTASVSRRVLHLLSDLALGLAFPQHGQRCKAPGRYARHKGVGRVRRLMARLARLCWRAVVILSPDDQRLMNNGGVGLPGGAGLVAIHASGMHDDARDRVEELRIGRGGRFDATPDNEPAEETWHEDTQGFSLQEERSG